jgi:hypothetical protein
VFVEETDGYPVVVSLKGLAIYSGVVGDKVSYWTDEDEESGQAAQEAGRAHMRVAVKPRNMTTARLALTGAPSDVCHEIADSTNEFDVALRALFEHTASWTGSAEFAEGSVISDV